MLLNERIRLRMVCSRRWRVANVCVMIGLVVGLSMITLNPSPQVLAEPNIQQPVGVSNSEPVADAKLQAVAISGTCVDERRKPVASAHVRLFRIDDSDKYFLRPIGRMKVADTGSPIANKETLSTSGGWGDPDKQRLLQEVRTDDKGRFEFAAMPADKGWESQVDDVYVVAQSPGRETVFDRPHITRGADGRPRVGPLKIKLPPSASLRGRITNADGRPVAGAIVTPTDSNYLARPLPGILCAVTDADGRFEISDMGQFDIDEVPPSIMPFGALKQVSMVATVEHADYAPGVIEYTKVPDSVDHVLQRAATLRGRVLDENGQPAEKVRVRWTHENGLSDAAPDTDAKGNYSLSRLLPGKYTITAHRDDRLDTMHKLQLVPGDNRLDLRMKIGAFLKGRLIDDQTGSAPRFDRSNSNQVNIILEGRDPSDLANICFGWVKEDGTFLTPVEPGHNLVQYFNPNFQLKDAERWNRKGIDLIKGQTAEIELRVVPRAGGWQSLLTEIRAAEAKAKGEPAPPPAAPEPKLNVGDSETEAMMRRFMDWPDEALPKKPMTEKTLLATLDRVGEVGRETIDGEEQIESIHLGLVDPNSSEGPLSGYVVLTAYSVLAHVDKFPHLKSFAMLGMPGGDEWLEPLRGHKQLQALCLNYSKNLTAEGIKHLTTLPNLKAFYVVGFKLGDEALAEINRFPKLEGLLFGGKITDSGIAHLKDNQKLKLASFITLHESKLTDESLRAAATLPNLEQLSIFAMGGDVRFTDDGLKHVAGMSKLTNLAIGGKQITDAGLVHLYEMKNLKGLELKGTSVTQKGIDELKNYLPEIKVTRSGS